MTAVIAKELAKTCDVTIVTFDEPSVQDTTMYGLGEASINYRFFHYPKVSYCKQKTLKVYSLLYTLTVPSLQTCSRPSLQNCNQGTTTPSLVSMLRWPYGWQHAENISRKFDWWVGFTTPTMHCLEKALPISVPNCAVTMNTCCGSSTRPSCSARTTPGSTPSPPVLSIIR